MDNTKSFNDDYFIKNAILCWLHHYPNHRWTPVYEELSLRDRYVTNEEEVQLPGANSLRSSTAVKKRPARTRVQGRSKATKSEV